MAGALAAVMVVVMLYNLAGALLPALRPLDHGRDVDAWHAVMAGAMAAMLITSWARPVSMVGLAAFVGGLAWALVHAAGHAAGQSTRAAYLRIGVGCLAMAAMLLPPATASAASPSADGAVAPGMAGMPGMGHAAPTLGAGRSDSGVLPPAVLLALVLAVLGVVLVLRLRGSLRTSTGIPARLDAVCDVAMAAAMGYMLALML